MPAPSAIRNPQSAVCRLVSSLLAALVIASAVGCATLFPPVPQPNGGFADNDKTLSQPLRKQTSDFDPATLPWYDLRKYMDPRSQQIEKHLNSL
jgi:hypothetical protein